MKRILVDMDGVIADVYSRFLQKHEEEFGIRLVISDISGLLEEDAFPNLPDWVNSPGFFRTIPVMPDSQETLKRLNGKYDLVIVSMATEFPNSLTDKQFWLHKNYPFISWRQLVFCGSKNLLNADIMIDDHPKNLDNFPGETIIFTQPHNMKLSGLRHRRVDSWKEIEKLLLQE